MTAHVLTASITHHNVGAMAPAHRLPAGREHPVRTVRIGRNSRNHIVIAGGQSTVAEVHAELVITDGGRLYLTDCATAHGTFVRRHGKWQRVRQDFIENGDRIRLGTYRTSVRELLSMLPGDEQAEDISPAAFRAAPAAPRGRDDDRPCGPVEFDPDTGEVVRKRP